MKEVINGVEFEYDLYPLVDRFDDVLHQATPEFNFVNPPTEPRRLAISLLKVMMKHGGVGLAAPQCGLPYRVFVMGSEREGIACFNPKIISTTGEIGFAEGCLSFKGLYLEIKRPASVDVEFQSWDGTVHKEHFDGLTARTYLHELDHLNGIVYTSLVSKYVLDKAKSKVATNLKRLQKQREAYLKQDIINKAIAKVSEEKRIEQLNKSLSFDIPDIELPIGANS